MTINYDKVADAVYLILKKGKVNKTINVKDGVNVDYDKKGTAIGIEILNFSSNQGSVKDLEKNLLKGVPVKISGSTPVLA